MTEPARQEISKGLATPKDGQGPGVRRPPERYCAFCGADADGDSLAAERFGEVFCSVEHAEEFVNQVRVARIQAAAVRTGEVATTRTAGPEQRTPRAPQQQGWKRYLKIGVCCSLPLLALTFLAGGGGMLLGTAGALLPLLAVVACPLGMYFMMRSMAKMERKDNPRGKQEER